MRSLTAIPIVSMGLALGLGSVATAGELPTLTEDLRYTASFADERLGQHASAYGRRCAGQAQSGSNRYLGWSTPLGWRSGSSTSVTEPSIADRRVAAIVSFSTVAVSDWPDGALAPPPQTPSYVSVSDATKLALDGDRLAISRAGAGRVLTYERNLDGDWIAEWEFMGGVGDHFGASIDLHGNTLVAGIPKDSGGSAGAVAIWTDLEASMPSGQPLPSPGGEAGNTFGAAVAIWGDWLAVGAPLEDTAFPQPYGTDVGAVYLFERGLSGFELRVTFFGEASGDHFGAAVDLQRDTLLVGAPFADNEAGDEGAAFVYRRDVAGLWGSVARLHASDRAPGHAFGAAVALSQPSAIVGAPWAPGSSGEAYAGALYFYDGLGVAIFLGDFEVGNTSRWSSAFP